MRARVHVRWLVSAGLALWVGVPALRAEEQPRGEELRSCPICRGANNQSAAYAEKAGSTLMRGATNTAFGWTELLTQPTEEVKAGGNLLVGVGKGVNQAMRRTFLGVGELLTFWTPKGPKGYLTLNRDCPICMGRPSPLDKR
jgi:putative exosortase-associated protein (TIGR04073 family)